MLKNKPNGFFSPSKGSISVKEMLKEISNFVGSDLKSNYRLVIGTDSQIKRVNKKQETHFITAIVIHRIGNGGKYFWSKEIEERGMLLRDKIYKETVRSLNTAQNIFPEIQNTLNPQNYELEIHIDVGQFGPTREMIKEVVNMVNGNGYKAKTKPDSWAASSVADKHT